MENLKEIAKNIRIDTIRSIGSIGVGHLGGCLSIIEILTALYFSEMRIDPKDPKKADRDIFVCSKGHGGPAVYATLANRGYFDKELLMTLNQNGTTLPSHCHMDRTAGIDMTTGSLGQGFSVAVGIAIAQKNEGKGYNTFCVIGDGESQEGQIWESAMLASKMKLNNFIAFTDRNEYQIDGSSFEIESLDPLDEKWRAFGFNVEVIDGHDIEEILSAISRARSQDKPTMIIAKTVKGKGVSFIEAKKNGSHNMPISSDEVRKAVEEVEQNG